MPKEVEDALRKQANKHKDWSEAKKKGYIYKSMTIMQEKDEIPKWRNIKHPKVKKK